MVRMSDTPIRVAVLGYGLAGRVFHCPFVSAVPGLELAAIAFRSADSAERNGPQAAQDYPTARILSSLEAAFDDSNIDLIVVATPNESHFDLAAQALRSGKHVVVDKPITGTSAEARQLISLATQQGKLLCPFHNRRFDGDFQTLRQLITSNTLGRIVSISSHFDRFRPVQRSGSWKEAAGQSNGLLFDLGPHLIDQTLYLFGLPDSVNASFATLRPGGQTDDWAHIQLNYDRLRVILHASILVSGGVARTTIHGNLGSWVKYRPDVQEKQLAAGMSPNDESFGYDPDPGIFFAGATGEQTEIAVPAGCGQLYYAGVRDAILNDQPAPIPAKDAVAVMAVLEASFESGKQGRTLPIPLNPEERAEWA